MCEPVTIGSMLTSLATSVGSAAAGIGTAVGGMSAFQVAGLALSAGSTLLSAKASHDQAAANKQVAQNNAVVAEYQAQDASRRGEQDAAALQRRAASLKSSQRVALGAHGLDLTYGSAADLQDQTDFFAQSDVATTRSNAAQEAWGHRAQGSNYQAQAKAISPGMAAAGSLMSGSAAVADKWYSYGAVPVAKPFTGVGAQPY